jgi:AbrB family looped-hinge helix DNA binding protein
MPRSTLTSKGQITIPKQVRDEMGLKPGDRVDFVRDRAGRTILQPIATDFRSLKGMIKSPLKRPITLKEMDKAIARGVLGK